MSVLPQTPPSELATPGSERSRRTSFILFGLLFLVYAATISHGLVSLDVWSANFGSWHLARTGNPWIEGLRVPPLDHSPLRHEWVLETHGHTVIGRSPGVIAASVPAYLVLGSASFSTVPGGLSAAALSAGAATLLYLALLTRLPRRTALLCTITFALGTPVWSVGANGMWPHTITVFGICGMAWASATGRWWWTGVFGGITLWGRLHAAVVVAVLGLLVGLHRRSWTVVVRVGVGSTAFLVLISVWTRWMYGTWDPTASYDVSTFTGYAQENRFSVTNQLGFWVSPDRGILVWTPVILLLLPALVRSWRDLPDWSRSLVWGGLAYTVLQGILNRFSGGDIFYGYRLGLEMLAALTPALAYSLPRVGRVARQLIGPVIALQVFAIAWGAARDSAYLPYDQVWHHNAFEVAVRHSGVGGWCGVALAIGLGVLIQRMWFRSAPDELNAEK
jgi:alpha-1,2-mannosyltransferase